MKNYKPIIASCAKSSAPTEKDFCHEKQQNAFFTCMKMNLIKIMANVEALKWAKDNCDTMQEYMLTNHKKILKKLGEVGKKYIAAECGSKTG